MRRWWGLLWQRCRDAQWSASFSESGLWSWRRGILLFFVVEVEVGQFGMKSKRKEGRKERTKDHEKRQRMRCVSLSPAQHMRWREIWAGEERGGRVTLYATTVNHRARIHAFTHSLCTLRPFAQKRGVTFSSPSLHSARIKAISSLDRRVE